MRDQVKGSLKIVIDQQARLTKADLSAEDRDAITTVINENFEIAENCIKLGARQLRDKLAHWKAGDLDNESMKGADTVSAYER